MEPAVAAAKAGKHVIVEKPLEITLKKCDRIIGECEKNGVQLATIFPSRFHDSSVKLKRAIDGGRFGRLTIGDAYVKWFRTQQYYDSGAWRGTWALDGGGALMNQAIHSVDLLDVADGAGRWKFSANTATLAHERIEVEDAVVATLRFANGALGVIEATTAAYPGYLKRIEIHGSEGSAVLEEEDLKAWDFAKPRKEDKAILDEMKKSQEHRRRGERPGRHRPSWPHEAIPRLARGDPQEPPARDRRPRGPPQRRDHSGDLQVGRMRRQGGQTAAAGRAGAPLDGGTQEGLAA